MANTVSKQWFKDNVSEDTKELTEIGELTNKVLYDRLSMDLNDPETTIAIYAKIFDAVTEVIVGKQKEYDNFNLNIANRLNIGYTTTSADDDEKVGNFMVYIQHIYNNSPDEALDEDETNTIELATQWNAANIKTQSDVIKEVAVLGKKKMSDLINIKTESNEYIIPLFCIIHQQIINYIRLKRVENKLRQYEINIAGLYTVGITETDDAEEEIYFVPSISTKLLFKCDELASRE